MDNDYIITVDENGQPYIAHWFGLGHKKPPKNHKYIAKIDTNRGPRYFYTKADLNAYYFGQKVKKKYRDIRDRLTKKRKGTDNTSTAAATSTPSVTTGTSSTVSSDQHSNRPVGRQRNVTGTVSKGSIYKRGEGLGWQTGSTTHGSFQQDSKTESNKDPRADSSAYYSKREYEASARKAEREFAKLGDRWHDLIKEERRISNSPEVKNAWERYNRYRDKYGKNSSQSKWAEQEYIKVTKPIRDIEAELREVWEQTNHQPYPNWPVH